MNWHRIFTTLGLVLLALSLTACAGSIVPSELLTTRTPTAAVATPRLSSALTKRTLINTPTPPPLTPYLSPTLLHGVHPETYVNDNCTYLRQRWHPTNSQPGTIVVPVMYHAVRKQANRGSGDTLTPAKYFQRTIAKANELGYQTVTATQVADFLEHNAHIPPRSLILIVDDRRLGTVEQFFLPVAEKNDWTVTLGWITSESASDVAIWERLQRLYATGRLDVQAHGLHHRYIVPETPAETIHEELFGPIPILQERFGRAPVAYVWPGGNFTKQAVAAARDAGYRIGFTVYARGPVMYNWIPLGPPEREMGDPLLVLPRHWGYPGLIPALEQAAAIGDAAREDALANYPLEAAYYRAHCGGDLPEPF